MSCNSYFSSSRMNISGVVKACGNNSAATLNYLFNTGRRERLQGCAELDAFPLATAGIMVSAVRAAPADHSIMNDTVRTAGIRGARERAALL